MKIETPDNLIFLWMLPVLLLFVIWRMQRAKAALNKFALLPILEQLTSEVSFLKKTLKLIIRFAALSLLLTATLRPQWGYTEREIKRQGLEIFVLLDVSKSMLANDVKPNRLKRAKREIKDLLKILRGDRIGIIPFAGKAFVSCPLTLDYGTAKMFLDDISIDTIPVGGTNFTESINRALKSFKDQKDNEHNIIIIISDGEMHDTEALKIAEKAKSKKVKIYTIGVGTPDGSPIPLPGKETSKRFLRDNEGNIVISKTNEKFLKELASTTGGTYARAGLGNLNLEEIYSNHIAKLDKKELKTLKKKQYTERFMFFLLPAILLLILEFLIGDKKRKKL